jgi:hypothetical protein
MAFAGRSLLLAVGLMILSARSYAQTNSLSGAEKDYQSAVEYAYGMNKMLIDDTKKALELYAKAGAQVDQIARDNLNRLSREMSGAR